MHTPATRPPLLLAGLVALAAATALAGCSTTVGGSAAPGSSTGRPAPDTSAAGSPGTPDGGCRVVIGGRGNIRISGASNRAVTRNGATSFSCAGGPLLAVDAVAEGAVIFSADGGAPVSIPAGETAAVADYEITVATAQGDEAEFVVAPPG